MPGRIWCQTLFLVCRWPPLCCVFIGQKERALASSSSCKGANATWGLHRTSRKPNYPISTKTITLRISCKLWVLRVTWVLQSIAGLANEYSCWEHILKGYVVLTTPPHKGSPLLFLSDSANSTYYNSGDPQCSLPSLHSQSLRSLSLHTHSSGSMRTLSTSQRVTGNPLTLLVPSFTP